MTREPLAPNTPLYKFLVVLQWPERPGVVFARDADEADTIAAALSGEQITRAGRGRTRTMHHPQMRGGLHEFTYGERLAEAHTRLRSAAAARARAA